MFAIRCCLFCLGVLMALICMVINKACRLWRMGTAYNFLNWKMRQLRRRRADRKELYAEVDKRGNAGEVT